MWCFCFLPSWISQCLFRHTTCVQDVTSSSQNKIVTCSCGLGKFCSFLFWMLQSAGCKLAILKWFVEIIFNSLLHAYACFSHANNTPLQRPFSLQMKPPVSRWTGDEGVAGLWSCGEQHGCTPKCASAPAAIQFARPVPLYPEPRSSSASP